jgi:hypothetical protein
MMNILRTNPLLMTVLIFCSLIISGCGFSYQTNFIEQEQASGVEAELTDQMEYGQTFLVTQDGLNRIDLYTATYARKNSRPVIFQIYSSVPVTESDRDKTSLVKIVLSSDMISNSGPTIINFAPLYGIANKKLYFSILSPGSKPGDAITVYRSEKDVYLNGEMLINGRPNQGDIAFIAYGNARIDFYQLISSFFLRIAEDKSFFVFYTFIGLGILFLLVWTSTIWYVKPWIQKRKNDLREKGHV